MPQKNSALNILKSRWSQAIVSGALTLIPGRRHPAWLRHTITWGSTASVIVLVANPRLGGKVLNALHGSSEQETSGTTEVSLGARVGSAAATGAAMYGMLRLGWWFDEAAEQGLRKLHVPFPRVVLGVGVGAFYYATGNREQRSGSA